MRVKLRLVLVALGFLVPGLLLARWMSAPELDGSAEAIRLLPAQLGPWRATAEQPLAEASLAIIAPDAYVQRRYEAPGRTPLWIYVGLYTGRAGSGDGAHDPEICYPAQGWEILRAQSRRLPLRGAESMSAKLLDVHQGVRKEKVLYWFQPAERWPGAGLAEEALRIVDALEHKPQYAFVRVSGPADSSANAERDLAAFAERAAPAIRAIVERVGDRGLRRAEEPETTGVARVTLASHGER